jgi:hypothetical protein
MPRSPSASATDRHPKRWPLPRVAGGDGSAPEPPDPLDQQLGKELAAEFRRFLEELFGPRQERRR